MTQNQRWPTYLRERPYLVTMLSDGTFHRLMSEAQRGRSVPQLLGPVVEVLRFNGLRQSFRRAGEDARWLYQYWPRSVVRFASGAIMWDRPVEEEGTEPRFFKRWIDFAELFVYVELANDRYAYDNGIFPETWEQLKEYADEG